MSRADDLAAYGRHMLEGLDRLREMERGRAGGQPMSQVRKLKDPICECRIEGDIEPWIIYCQLHQAMPGLLEALRAISQMRGKDDFTLADARNIAANVLVAYRDIR